METDKRIVYHFVDGSILEIIGEYVETIEQMDGYTKYTMVNGKVFAVRDESVAYYVVEDGPGMGDGYC